MIVHVHGDSQVATAWANCRASETMPYVLAKMLTAAGYPFTERNSGLGGSSSSGYGVGGLQRLFLYEPKPDVAVFAHGYNDVPNGLTAADTTLALRKHILSAKFEVMGTARKFGDESIYTGTDLSAGVWVATEASLPANCKPGARVGVSADGSSDGGRMAPGQTVSADATGILDSRLHPTITGAGAGAPTVWEARHPIAGVYGWGRVGKSNTQPWGVRRIAVEGMGYLNIIGGNTPADATGTIAAGGYAGYEIARAGQLGAVTAEALTVGGAPGVIFVNQFEFMRQRILTGLDPDDSAGYTTGRNWHRNSGNQHYNAYGHQLRAQNMLAEIIENWTDDGEWIA